MTRTCWSGSCKQATVGSARGRATAVAAAATDSVTVA
jgi:hypothetical protein